MASDSPGRIALATANLTIPEKRFVLAHRSILARHHLLRTFTYALRAAEPPKSLGVHQPFSTVPLPFGARRRAYRLTSRQLTSSVQRWRPDVVHLHFMALGGFAADAARSAAVPLVTTVHAQEPILIGTGTSARERWLASDCQRVLEGTSAFLAVSNYIAEWLESVGVSPDQIRTHYLGIDTDYWSASIPSSSRLSAQHIVFVGHLTELKGVRDAVNASIRLQHDVPHRLSVVGRGPLLAELQERTRSQNHINLAGSLERDKVRAMLAAATCLVLPTQTVDGISDAAPTVLMEAQAMGVPVVSYRVGGTVEMVPPTYAHLVTEKKVDELSQALRTVLNLGESDYNTLSQGVSTWIRERRSTKGQAAMLPGIYREVGALL